jgi:hypothetical protein
MRRILLLLAALCLSVAAFAQTPPAPPQLTWIRYYEAGPGHEMELTKLLSESSKAVFDKLIAEKKVVGWGIAVPMSHTGEPWTHVAYVGFADWSAVDAMSNAFEALDAKMAPAELKKMDDQFAAAMKPNSMRDVVIRHITQGPPSNLTKPKYIGVDTYVIKPGRFEDAAGLFNEWPKPIFGDTASKGGKVGPWGLSVQDMVTTPGWTHMIWYFMNDLTAIDEMNAANMALGPMKLKGYDVRLRDLSEPEKHQGQILRIVYQQP